MKSDNPVFQIVSLLMLFGPIVLFWYIDWYWIVGYYNLFCAYSCYSIFKQYNNDKNFRRKYHIVVYVGLPLFLNFLGLLISILNGFEEIKDGSNSYDEKKSEKSGESEVEVIQIKSNEELRSYLDDIAKEDIKSFSVDILYDKWTFFEEIDYKGTFKSFDFILKGGTAIKWSKHKGCYKNDLAGFLDNIKNKEINEIAFQSLNYDCDDSDQDYDYNFYDKIIWDENTPGEIIKDVEKNYSENEYEKLRDEIELEEDYLDIELFEKKGFISQFDFSINYQNKVKSLKWLKDEGSVENNSEIPDFHFINKEFIEDLGRLYNTIDKDKYQKEAYKRWRDFFEKQLDAFFSDWEEDGSFHDDYDILISEKDDYYIESFYNTHEYKSDKIEIVDFLIRNRKVEIELDHLPIILPVIFYNEEPYVIFNFPYNYNDSSNFIGNHFSFYIDGGLLEVCEKLSKLKMKDFKEEIMTQYE